jgi:hypothetical protein
VGFVLPVVDLKPWKENGVNYCCSKHPATDRHRAGLPAQANTRRRHRRRWKQGYGAVPTQRSVDLPWRPRGAAGSWRRRLTSPGKARRWTPAMRAQRECAGGGGGRGGRVGSENEDFTGKRWTRTNCTRGFGVSLLRPFHDVSLAPLIAHLSTTFPWREFHLSACCSKFPPHRKTLNSEFPSGKNIPSPDALLYSHKHI